ncbi:hypothetical protein FOMPIDRAFT_1060560 [Fomitopsis schrenkii]|uniref:DUF6534 domain-containing protein n=1 Tax=Fomitopsis schrenkii TaxID=2126942 RepID=S8E9M8_FOMSC|nr:hypothetical protein FOMPIDRAFT_1060560 [Fomitopsis schrenkii]
MGELDRTYGAVVIGAFLAAVLFGITNLQTFIYFQRYPSDRLWNKISVCWLWLLDAVHLALCVHMVYWYLVTNFLNPFALVEIVWSFKAQIIVDWVTYLPLGAATFVDVIIALSLCYFLERCRIGSTSSGIDSTITLLMVYTLNTGVITSLCSLTAIVTMAALPTTFAVISVEFMLTKLYVNSFLAMFNARNKLRGLGSIVDADAVVQPLSSSATSSPTDRKVPAFAFSPTNSTGRSDLRVSICLDALERAPVVDVDVEHGHSIHFPWPAGSAGSCEDRDAAPTSIGRHAPLVPRAGGRPRRVPSPSVDSASSATATVTTVADSYNFGKTRIPRRSAYDVFTPKRPDSSLLGNVDEIWDGSQSQTTRAQTPSELIGMALTKDA